MEGDWLDVPPEPARREVTIPRPMPCPFKDADMKTVRRWKALTYDKQVFLTVLPHVKFNQTAALRQMRREGFDTDRYTAHGWAKSDEDFVALLDMMRAVRAGRILDKANLIIRQDSIVEQLLKPQPVLYQGAPTGFYENRAPAAASANETLMKAAGLLKGDQQSTRVTVRIVNLAGAPEAEVAPIEGEATVVE